MIWWAEPAFIVIFIVWVALLLTRVDATWQDRPTLKLDLALLALGVVALMLGHATLGEVL